MLATISLAFRGFCQMCGSPAGSSLASLPSRIRTPLLVSTVVPWNPALLTVSLSPILFPPVTRVTSWTCVVVATTLSVLPPEAPADDPPLPGDPPHPASRTATEAAPSKMRSLRTSTPRLEVDNQNDNRSQKAVRVKQKRPPRASRRRHAGLAPVGRG